MLKRLNGSSGYFMAAAALLAVTLGCSSSATNTGTANSSANTAANTPSTATSPAPSAPRNISGEYDAKGTNPDGGAPYQASLTVTPRDDVYQFSWMSGKTDYDGVAVVTDSAAAVAYTTGKDGKGCGVVLYQINADGSLDGKVGYWGENKMETEKAVRKSGTDLEGEYEISGKNPEGEEYKGKLTVKKEGPGYDFTWSAPDTLKGFGIRGTDLVAVGFGGAQCAFVGYDIKPDGTLDGKWGARGSKSLGTEVATRKK